MIRNAQIENAKDKAAMGVFAVVSIVLLVATLL